MGSENSSAIRYMAQNPAGRSAAGRRARATTPDPAPAAKSSPATANNFPAPRAHPELEETGMGEQPQDARPARRHQRPAFGPAQGPDAMD